MGFILNRFLLPLVLVALCAVCGKSNAAGEKTAQDPKTTFSFERPLVLHDKTQKVAIFAGGCFWCMESPFEKLAGVKAVIVGYTDGKEKKPTYSEVSYGNTGHVEAVLVVYNPKVVQYERLLDVYWQSINPEQDDGQFYDRGDPYKPYIFISNKEERKAAEDSSRAMAVSGKFVRIAVKIKEASAFWPAEDFHQGYYKKNPKHYAEYVNASGRKAYLESKWDK